MIERRRAAALLAAAAVCLPAAGWAEDEAPQDAAQRAAAQRAEAAAATQAALRALEAYGRGATAEPPDRDELRIRALDRLRRATHPAPAAGPRPRPEFDPAWAREGLTTFRQALLARLRQLAPEAYAPPRGASILSEPVRRTFDVQDLVVAPLDHVGPASGLGGDRRPQGGADGGGGVISFFDEECEPTAGVGLGPDLLVELVERDGEVERVEYANGELHVRASPEALVRIERLLAELRAPRAGLVDLDVRLYALPASLFWRLRGRSEALDEAREQTLAQAVTRNEARLLSAHRVVAHDGQRVVVRRGRARSFVGDIEINQTGVIPVACPVVRVLNEGHVLELRPLVDRGAGRVLVDLAITVCQGDETFDTRDVQGLELELPRAAIARTTATSNVPLGRGALMGGVLLTGEEDGLASVVYVRPRLIQSQAR